MSSDMSMSNKPEDIFVALPARPVADRIDMPKPHASVITIATSFDAAKHLLSNIPNRRGPRVGSIDQA